MYINFYVIEYIQFKIYEIFIWYRLFTVTKEELNTKNENHCNFEKDLKIIISNNTSNDRYLASCRRSNSIVSNRLLQRSNYNMFI